MTEIRIDRGVAERIVAQVLRDEFKMLPEKANEAAENIGRRLLTSLPTPSTPGLNGGRIIRQHCPIDFIEASRKMIKEDRSGPRAYWQLAYDYSDKLPPVLSDDEGSYVTTVRIPTELVRKR